MLETLEFYQQQNPAIFCIPGHGGKPVHPKMAEWEEALQAEQVTPGLIAQAGAAEVAPEARAQELAADLWGAARCFWLFGGASQGNHAMLIGLTKPHDLVLAARGSHLSLVYGLVLSGAQVSWVGDTWDEDWQVLLPLQPDDLAQALDSLDEPPRAVVATSPTYFGQVADIAALSEICHQHNVPLWVDGSWGSHFGFHPGLPAHPLQLGADILVSSTHKHAGSLRGSAMLLAADSPFVGDADISKMQQALQLLSSTSPNPLMRFSLDAVRWQLANHGEEIWGGVLEVAEYGRSQLAGIDGLRVLDADSSADEQDRTRLVLDVSPSGWNGMHLSKQLISEHGVLPELSSDRILVMMLNQGNTHEDMDRLAKALTEELSKPAPESIGLGRLPAPGEPVMTPREAALGSAESVALESSVGRVAAEAVALYPPGIPALLPGCTITQQMVDYLKGARDAGARLAGGIDPGLEAVRVVTEA
jgi:lysine decarboxylase